MLTGPPADDGVAAFRLALGLPVLVDAHVYFMPPRAEVTKLDWGMSWVPNLEACLLVRHSGGRPVLVPSVPAGRFFDTPEEGVAKLAEQIEQAYSAAVPEQSPGQRPAV